MFIFHPVFMLLWGLLLSPFYLISFYLKAIHLFFNRDVKNIVVEDAVYEFIDRTTPRYSLQIEKMANNKYKGQLKTWYGSLDLGHTTTSLKRLLKDEYITCESLIVEIQTSSGDVKKESRNCYTRTNKRRGLESRSIWLPKLEDLVYQ